MKRLGFIDIARGIGMLSVIIGHNIIIAKSEQPFETLFCDFFWSFHMPMFFILSGYFLDINKYTIKEQLIKDARHILLPCVSTIFASFLCNFLLGQIAPEKMLLKTIGVFCLLVQPIGVWFLLSLFWGRLFCKIALGCKNYQIGILILLALNALALVVPFRYVQFIPFLVGRGLVSPAFILIGILCRKKRIFDKWSYATLWSFIALLILVGAPKVVFDTSRCEYPLFMMNIITSTSITISFLYVCYLLDIRNRDLHPHVVLHKLMTFRVVKSLFNCLMYGYHSIIKLVCFIGRHSLAVLCYHAFLISAVRLQNYIPVKSQFVVGVIVSTIITLLVYIQTMVIVYFNHNSQK